MYRSSFSHLMNKRLGLFSRLVPRGPRLYTSTTTRDTPSRDTITDSINGNGHIERLASDISALTLLQAADLVKVLKSRLNIQEPVGWPAGMMPVANSAASSPGAAKAEEEEEEEEKPKEKSEFNLKLQSFDAGAKAKIIREVKALLPGLNLVEAKKLVESAPKVLKEKMPKEEAEKLRDTLTSLGAVVVLE